MPAFTLLPTSQGSFSGWTLLAGASKPAAMAANDGDSTKITTNASTTDSYNVTDLPADAATISGSVTFGATAKDNFNWAQNFQVSAYNGSSTTAVSATLTNAFVHYSGAVANVPGGTGWTVAQVNAIQIGVFKSGVERVDATYAQVTGTYLQAGMYFTSIYNLIPPLLVGASLLHKDFLRMVEYSTRWINGCRIIHTAEEIKQAWREYKEGRRPIRYFDLGARQWQILEHSLVA